MFIQCNNCGQLAQAHTLRRCYYCNGYTDTLNGESEYTWQHMLRDEHVENLARDPVRYSSSTVAETVKSSIEYALNAKLDHISHIVY